MPLLSGIHFFIRKYEYMMFILALFPTVPLCSSRVMSFQLLTDSVLSFYTQNLHPSQSRAGVGKNILFGCSPRDCQ